MTTVLHRLHQWANDRPSDAAQQYKEGNDWKTITSKEFRDRVFYLALFLESKGFTKDDVNVIFSYNRPEWVHADLAPQLLGGKSAGLYPNSSFKDVHYILEHTGCKILCVQDQEYFDKIIDNGKGKIPSQVELIIVFDGNTDIHEKAISYDEAIGIGKELAANKSYDNYLQALDPKSGAFLIYTSGTTGQPKGALLSHDNLAYTSDLVKKTWNLHMGNGSTFSFLPLCHIAEKLQNIGVGISCRYTVKYCSKFDNLAADLGAAKPTLMLSVPRLWEKMMEGVVKKVNSGNGTKEKLARWSLKVGAMVAEKKYGGKMITPMDRIKKRIANKLVLSKVKGVLGLDAVELAASGAAALPGHVAKWFRALDIEILEDFGQTESTGVITMTIPGVDCTGTVGKPVDGTEFKIAEDGELLTKGRHVFVGYFKNQKATDETVIDGWLHTGDLGVYDDRGMVQIRGRKKEIMKTSGGKMVAPLPIEEKLKESPIISQACMVGDGKKYFSVLITLAEGLEKNSENERQVAERIKEVNKHLAGYEQVKHYTVLDREFSVEDGEMTPTLKMKRAVIERNCSSLIDKMYNDGSKSHHSAEKKSPVQPTIN